MRFALKPPCRVGLFAIVVVIVVGSAKAARCGAAEPARKTIWQGAVHLGDSPDQYSNVPTAGMAIQIACQLAFEKKGRLLITTRDIQTLAGQGHYAELVAHYEDGSGTEPAREYVVETFRLKGDSTNVDLVHSFEFDAGKGLNDTPPAYYSIRVRIDTCVKFTLWDDFILKRIEIEQ